MPWTRRNAWFWSRTLLSSKPIGSDLKRSQAFACNSTTKLLLAHCRSLIGGSHVPMNWRSLTLIVKGWRTPELAWQYGHSALLPGQVQNQERILSTLHCVPQRQHSAYAFPGSSMNWPDKSRKRVKSNQLIISKRDCCFYSDSFLLYIWIDVP